MVEHNGSTMAMVQSVFVLEHCMHEIHFKRANSFNCVSFVSPAGLELRSLRQQSAILATKLAQRTT